MCINVLAPSVVVRRWVGQAVVATLLLMICAGPMVAQNVSIATTGALEAPLSVGSAVPTLPVMGQTAVGVSRMGHKTAFIGIDYIRMFSQASTTVYVELPDTTVRVSDYIRIPVVVRRVSTDREPVRIRTIEIRFSYRCEVVELYGVDERDQQNGECIATLRIDSLGNDVDTVWIDGVSKLCSITSTPLTGISAQASVDRGRIEIGLRNGELRQDGHCVTNGSTRLVFSTVGVTSHPYPASSYVDVNLTGLAQHQGVLRLLDLNGNEVMHRFVSSGPNGLARDRMDISQLASGSYTIHYVHERGVSSATVLVYR